MTSIPAAATLILVRELTSGYQVFLIKRPSNGAFPGLHVFPGGKVDQQDENLIPYTDYLTDQLASIQLGVSNRGLRFWVTAIRECFEECGVLFANQGNEAIKIDENVSRTTLNVWRDRLNARDEYFEDILKENSLTLATSKIHYFSHWITPEVIPTRFDTRFFLAELPPRQDVVIHQSEVISGSWVSPEEALQQYSEGHWRMILPTLTSLRMIASYPNLRSLIDSVKAGYHKIPVVPSLPFQSMQSDINFR